MKAAVKPTGGGWSVLECAEHVATAERVLFLLLKTKSEATDEEMSRERETALYERGKEATRKFEAPEATLPTGRYATLSDAVGAFLDARARTVAWLEKSGLDLRRRAVPHPLIGQVSAYELVLIMAAHPARHARQIVAARGR